MVFPNKIQGETRDDYISRCSGDVAVMGMYPDMEQRIAVCGAHFDTPPKDFAKDGTVKSAEIFAVGKWNGHTFTESDLYGIVNAFNKLREFQKVPLKLGHNPEQKVTDGQPALGWVDDIWVSGKKLMARFVDVPKIIMEALDRRKYRTVSIELDVGVNFKGAKFSNVLSAVALLGADIPAVGNLADLKMLMAKDDVFTSTKQLSFSAINGTIKEDSKMTEEEMRAAIAKAQAEAATARTEALNFKAQAELATTEKEQLAKAEAKRAEEEAKKAVEFSRKAIADTLEAAVKAGKITPAKRLSFEKILRIEDDEAVKAVSLEDVKALIGDETSTNFSKDTSMQGDDKGERTTSDAGQELADQASIYAAEHGVSFTKAIDVCMRKDRKLAREYIDSNGSFTPQ